jgi:hypothetical protein
MAFQQTLSFLFLAFRTELKFLPFLGLELVGLWVKTTITFPGSQAFGLRMALSHWLSSLSSLPTLPVVLGLVYLFLI